jgi:transcriptional regulator with XRE-family HTH domain
MTDLRKQIGHKLEVAFRRSGMSLTDFAKKSGVSRESIYAYFAGERDLGVEFLAKMSEALDISPASFFSQSAIVDLAEPSLSEIIDLLALYRQVGQEVREIVVSTLSSATKKHQRKSRTSEGNDV